MKLSKSLIAASATPLILSILARGDSYGYAIIKQVRELSSDHIEWADGMLYPVLHRLEQQGCTDSYEGVSERGRKRRYYRITAAGVAELSDQRDQWRVVQHALRAFLAGPEKA